MINLDQVKICKAIAFPIYTCSGATELGKHSIPDYNLKR
jgi:hypothetical protein